MPEVQLNKQNVLERGFTPPPEEKVAFYIYNQQKYRAEPPDSDRGSVLSAYHKERNAWAPELPSDWQPHQDAFNRPQNGGGASGHQTTTGGAQTNSGPGRSTLPSISHFHDGKYMSPDPEFAALENEVMDEGTEIDYDVGPNNHDVKSDVQEMSAGQRTPMTKPIQLQTTPPKSRPSSNLPKHLLRDSAFGFSTPMSGNVDLPGGTASPRTTRAADIHITIQPPTDPSLSKAPSIAPSVRAPRSQAGTITQEEMVDRQGNVRDPTWGSNAASMARARGPTGSPKSPPPSSRVTASQVRGETASKANGGRTAPSQSPSVSRPLSNVPPSTSHTQSKVSRSQVGSAVNGHRVSTVESIPPPVPSKDTPKMYVENRFDPDIEWEELYRASNFGKTPSKVGSRFDGRATPRGSQVGSVVPPLPQSPSQADTARPPSRIGTDRPPSVIPSAKMTDDDHSTERAISPPRHGSPKPLHPLTSLINQRVGSPGPSTSHSQSSPHRQTHVERALSPTPSKRPRAQSRTGSHAPSRSREDLGKHPTGDATPRAMSPLAGDRPASVLTEKEALELLRTPRTTYTVTPSDLAAEVQQSHFHDEDLCVLLHVADDPSVHDVVRRAVRKAVRSRVKRLGFETEAQYRNAYMKKGKHDHRASYASTMQPRSSAPDWAKPLFQLLEEAHVRLDGLDQKIESSRPPTGLSQNDSNASYPHHTHHVLQHHEELDDVPSVDYEPGADALQTPRTQTQILPQATGDHHLREDDYDIDDDDDWGNEEVLHREEGIEESHYTLHVKPSSQSDKSHQTWLLEQDDGHHPDIASPTDDEPHHESTPSLPAHELVSTASSGPAFPRPPANNQQLWATTRTSVTSEAPLPSWQRVHQRLLNWAMVWSMSEFEHALESTERGHQVDEVALSIWTAQIYKRYVRGKTTDNPPQKVDRLFVPPNVADAINSAVYNGRHRDACTILKDMWTPFGFEGMPRLLIVLARHRRDANHWVVHRFSIPDGTLSTYDTYPDKSLADGRPLGWWFAIRAAWPHSMYPQADLLVQKLVRIHRPLQLLIDNSVAAAAIWRNLIMGSKAERSVDLVRLRDLINTEVRALRSRKDLGKLTLPSSGAAAARGWDE